MNDHDKAMREQVVYLLRDGGAHMSFDDFIAGFPPELCGRRVAYVPYTPWQVLEHMRIAQWDILEFSRNPKHVSPEFPKGYWPPPDTAGNPDLWKESAEKFRHDLEQMQSLVADPAVDLFAKIPHGDGQTLLREAMLVADHNAYHLGVLAVMGRLLEAKP